MSSEKIKCTECSTEFSRKKNMYAHLRKFHKIEPLVSRKNPDFNCSNCSATFSSKVALVRHHRKFHTSTKKDEDHFPKRQSRLICPYGTCSESFANYARLRNHLENVHSAVVELEHLEFDLMESFYTWKKNIELMNLSFYTRDSGFKQISSTSDIKRQYFNCHRSHFYRPMGNGRKAPKTTGSCKIGKACPSRIVVEIILNQDEPLPIKVKYWKTHYGHSIQLKHVPLDVDSRDNIAEQLKKGFSFEEIFDSIKEAILRKTNVNPRLSLLTRKDLHNIIRDYNINYSTKHDDKIKRKRKEPVCHVNPIKQEVIKKELVRHENTKNQAETVQELTDEFIRLFNDGYSPSEALRTYKKNLLEFYGDSCTDGTPCPSIKWVQDLYSIKNNMDQPSEEEMEMFTDEYIDESCEKDKYEHDDNYLNLENSFAVIDRKHYISTDVCNNSGNIKKDNEVNQVVVYQNCKKDTDVDSNEVLIVDVVDESKEDDTADELQKIFDILTYKYKSNNEYKKPIKKFIRTFQTCKMDESLIKALNRFGQ